MYFDSHSHLDEACFDADREKILKELPDWQVEGLIDVGCDLESSRRAVAFAETRPNVWAAVGSHPDDADHVDEALLQEYISLAAHEKAVAVGEIGLDYHYEDVPREIQKRAFRQQMELARELDLPVIVHQREAQADALEIVKAFPEVTGVFHCFSGSTEMALELIKRGWYVGFTGVLTFKNARRAVETARAVPLDRILIETDCPYMSPEPYRGRRNDSRLVSLVGKKLAQLLDLPEQTVMEATTENVKRLFRL